MTFQAHLIASTLSLFLAAPVHHGPSPLVRFFFKFGLAGLPIISAIDSSFVPLPIPGVTDIMIILYAAGKANVFLLVGLATLGSAVGGFLSHAAGRAGGMAFLEKHVPERFLKPISSWMENHAILAVALPALLPPPMPLSPFVLIAGAVHMTRKKFMTAFVISRFLRHSLAAWIGIHYGRHVLRLWNQFSAKWGATILTVIWSVIIVFVVIAIWKLYQTSRDLKDQRSPRPEATPAT
jgi:membrane protein YqaA with SNARE-associated domain